MNSTLQNIKTKDEFVKYLWDHHEKGIPYTSEEREHLNKLLRQFGLSSNVLRMHYDIPKKK